MMIRILLTIIAISLAVPANAGFWIGGGSGGAGVPGGTNTQVQYNNAGAFAGTQGLTYDAVNAKLTIGYQSEGGGYTGDLMGTGGGAWTKSRQMTVVAPVAALPFGYPVKVVLIDAAAASVFNSGTVDAVRISTSVVGTTMGLTANITATQTTLPVGSAVEYTDCGVVRIENEYIYYNSKNGTTLLGCVRGIRGSTAATHAQLVNVDYIQEIDRYIETYTGSSIVIWFKLRAGIAGGGNSTEYKLYYENDLAIAGSNVLLSMLETIFTKNLDADANLLGEWHIDEGTGSTIADSSGNGNNGSLVNAPTWQLTDGGQWDGAAGINFSKGSYLSFNGTTQYAQLATTALGMVGATARSTEFWLYQPNNAVGSVVEWGWSDSISQSSWNVIVGLIVPANHLAFWGRSADYDFGLLAAGEWNHVVVNYNGTTLVCYINNVQTFSTAVTLQTQNTAICVARNHNGVYYYGGRVDAVRLRNRILLEDEINASYKRRKWITGDTKAIDGNFVVAGSEGVSGAAIGGIRIYGTPVYADNAAAIAGGLVANDEYQTATGVQMRVY